MVQRAEVHLDPQLAPKFPIGHTRGGLVERSRNSMVLRIALEPRCTVKHKHEDFTAHLSDQ